MVLQLKSSQSSQTACRVFHYKNLPAPPWVENTPIVSFIGYQSPSLCCPATTGQFMAQLNLQLVHLIAPSLIPLTDPRKISVPACLSICLGCRHWIWRCVDASANNEEIGASFYRTGWCLVLLAEWVSLARHVNSGSEDSKIFFAACRMGATVG